MPHFIFCRPKASIDPIVRVSNSVFYISRGFICNFIHIVVGCIFHFIVIRLVFDMNILIKGYRKVIINEIG